MLTSRLIGWVKAPVVRYAATALVASAAGIGGIKTYEGSSKTVYLDPVGIPTVCSGHTKSVSRADVGRKFSDAACDDLLRQDTKVAEAAVKKYVTVPITQAQYDALVSFTFNVGSGNLARSTLLKRVNANQCLSAGEQFLRWNRANGQVLRGLTLRRQWERDMWVSGCYENQTR